MGATVRGNIAALVALAACATGCSAITGFGDLSFGARDLGPSDDGGLDASRRDAGDATLDLGPADVVSPDAGDALSPDAGGCDVAACNDGITCTVDSCGADGRCEHRANDDLCEPGSACDVDLRGCVGGPCTGSADCDDGVVCTDDRCEGSVCIFAARSCDDGDPCTLDSCDSETGECVTRASPNGVRCDDLEPGFRCCAGVCRDTRSDLAHCGGCTRACGANESCAGGACACLDGFQSCDEMPGCESRIATDPTSCGGCGTVCPASEPTCSGGRCSACVTGADCADDGLDCTGTPTCMAGRCAHPLAAGRCLIEGQCRRDGEINPVDQCRVCTPSASTTAWSVRLGQPCDDGNGCTEGEVCTAVGTCVGSARVCDDGLACTLDGCDPPTGVCTFTPSGSGCAIGGACVMAGAHNPMNTCQVCDPVRDRTAWSPATGACDDGLFCTTGDTCTTVGGGPRCVGAPRSCDDSRMCTTDTCNETLDRCNNQPMPGVCFFDANGDGSPDCVPDAMENPANGCQWCNPSESTTRWSERGNGDECNAPFGVCCDGVCQARLSAPCRCTGCSGTSSCCNGVLCCAAGSSCCGTQCCIGGCGGTCTGSM